jgi:hypothetical protein
MNELNTKKPTDFVSLLDDSNNVIFNMTSDEAAEAIISGDAARVRNDPCAIFSPNR